MTFLYTYAIVSLCWGFYGLGHDHGRGAYGSFYDSCAMFAISAVIWPFVILKVWYLAFQRLTHPTNNKGR